LEASLSIVEEGPRRGGLLACVQGSRILAQLEERLAISRKRLAAKYKTKHKRAKEATREGLAAFTAGDIAVGVGHLNDVTDNKELSVGAVHAGVSRLLHEQSKLCDTKTRVKRDDALGEEVVTADCPLRDEVVTLGTSMLAITEDTGSSAAVVDMGVDVASGGGEASSMGILECMQQVASDEILVELQVTPPCHRPNVNAAPPHPCDTPGTSAHHPLRVVHTIYVHI